MFYLDAGPTLRKYPLLGVLVSAVLVIVLWLALQGVMNEARVLLKQKSPALVSVGEATRFYGIRWVTLSDGTWHCADAVRMKRRSAISRLISGPIESTELPITGEDAADVVVAVFDDDFDCSGTPVRLSGVIGSDVFGGSGPRTRWLKTGRRLAVLSVDTSPSSAVWLLSAAACAFLGVVGFLGYFVRLAVLKYANPER